MEADDAHEVVVPESDNGNNNYIMGFQNENEEDIWPEYCNPTYSMPEVIEVKVAVGEDHYFFPVTVIKAVPRSKVRKEGLGNIKKLIYIFKLKKSLSNMF